MVDKKIVLDTHTVLAAYCQGLFPMADSRAGSISWYSPDPRAIIPLDQLRISRSLRQTLKKGIYEVTLNACFGEVMGACADREETWISEEIIRTYRALHEEGFAHSVEVWRDRGLAGGLYGVAIRGAFFGESMFSRQTDASKAALVYLVERLRARRYLLLDAQFMTPHLRRLGAIEISKRLYLRRLASALAVDTTFVE